MDELVQAINRLATAQEESNKICKLNTELLHIQKAQLKKSISSLHIEDKDKNNL